MPNRHALLVGINRYPNFAAKNQLANCVRDAERMAFVLQERFGFAEADLIHLHDEAATRDGILAGLAELRARARSGDLVVFYYSGHGSELADSESQEPDGWNQTIVPSDSGRGEKPNRDIVDDEIHDWLLDVGSTTPNVVVIADTCFSGGVVREVEWARVKRVEHGVLPRAERLPSPFPKAPRVASVRDVGFSGVLPPDGSYVLLAACGRGEHAKELTERGHGVYTYHLAAALMRLSAGANYRDLHESVRSSVTALFRDQTPQLEGARNREVFAGSFRRPDPYLAVTARDGIRITLAGGQVHGVGAGAVWGIYPAGTHRPAEDTALGRVRVQNVGPFQSEAVVQLPSLEDSAPANAAPGGEDTPPITAGCRAFEDEKGPGWMRLSVAVEEGGTASPEDHAILVSELQRSPLLFLESDRARADLTIVAGETQEAKAEESSRPKLTWEVQGPDGAPLLPPQPRRQPLAAEDLARLLDREALARNLRSLAVPPEENDPLAACLHVKIGRRGADGAFLEVLEDPKKGMPVFQEGDALAIEIVHTAEVPLQIHVLDIGSTGNRCQLFPPPGAEEDLLPPNRALPVDDRTGFDLTLSLPPDLPASLTGAREVLKIFATTSKADLTFWESAAIRGGPPLHAPHNGLRSLLAQAHGAAVLRQGPGAAGEAEEWTVLTRSFWVERVPRKETS